MKGNKAVVGVYTYVDDIIDAINSIKSSGLDYRVYAPTFVHELDHVIDKRRSWVALVTLLGGIVGLVSGFALSIWCALDYPLRVSAKGLESVPGYVVIGYECTILFGAIATLLGVFHLCRLPSIFRAPGYDPRFSYDKFGLVVGCDKEKVSEIETIMKDSGADETKVDDGF